MNEIHGWRVVYYSPLSQVHLGPVETYLEAFKSALYGRMFTDIKNPLVYYGAQRAFDN